MDYVFSKFRKGKINMKSPCNLHFGKKSRHRSLKIQISLQVKDKDLIELWTRLIERKPDVNCINGKDYKTGNPTWSVANDVGCSQSKRSNHGVWRIG